MNKTNLKLFLDLLLWKGWGGGGTQWPSLFNIWKSNQIRKETKLKLFKNNLLWVLLYCCEYCQITKAPFKCLWTNVWQEKISNIELFRRIAMDKTELIIRGRKWRLIGYIHADKRNNSILKEALEWNSKERLRKWRPNKTWRWSPRGKKWATINMDAKNRIGWKHDIYSHVFQPERRG